MSERADEVTLGVAGLMIYNFLEEKKQNEWLRLCGNMQADAHIYALAEVLQIKFSGVVFFITVSTALQTRHTDFLVCPFLLESAMSNFLFPTVAMTLVSNDRMTRCVCCFVHPGHDLTGTRLDGSP